MSKETRKVKAGYAQADVIIEAGHMMYNHRTARGFVEALIARLQTRKDEYKPVKQGMMGKNKKGKA